MASKIKHISTRLTMVVRGFTHLIMIFTLVVDGSCISLMTLEISSKKCWVMAPAAQVRSIHGNVHQRIRQLTAELSGDVVSFFPGRS